MKKPKPCRLPCEILSDEGERIGVCILDSENTPVLMMSNAAAAELTEPAPVHFRRNNNRFVIENDVPRYNYNPETEAFEQPDEE